MIFSTPQEKNNVHFFMNAILKIGLYNIFPGATVQETPLGKSVDGWGGVVGRTELSHSQEESQSLPLRRSSSKGTEGDSRALAALQQSSSQVQEVQLVARSL